MKKKSIIEAMFGVTVTVISLAILLGFIESHSIFIGIFFLCTAIGWGIMGYKKRGPKNKLTN